MTGGMTANQPLLTPEELWRKYDAVETKLTAPVSERMLDLAGLRAGMRLLDLATGRGEPALRAARRVGPQGFVLGVELSGPVLQMAREKAILEGLSNLDLRIGNAEVPEDVPTAYFHAAAARWGLMYMDSPISALSSARRALVADGVFVAALWGEPERVPYFTLPRRLLARYRELPPIDREAPGTFRYADPARITRDFGEAGFSIEHVEEMEVPVMEAETSAELLGWVQDLGLGRLLNGLPEHDQQAWEDEMTIELERLRTGAVVRLGGVTRIVLARRTH
jgi:ubiquinone/menaquinone biosynthesis C-methylase UbiE